jgi:hypothetical protein
VLPIQPHRLSDAFVVDIRKLGKRQGIRDRQRRDRRNTRLRLFRPMTGAFSNET